MIIKLTFENFDRETPSYEELVSRMRSERNRLLSECDWTQLSDTQVNKEGWALYRQQLRDAPKSWEPALEWIAPDPPA